MPQTERNSRWITIKQPFDYYWPSRAVTHYSEPGEQLVKNEVADFAVEKGYAVEGKLDGSAKSRKGKRARRKKEAPAATAADTAGSAGMADQDVPAADRPADGRSVDTDAG